LALLLVVGRQHVEADFGEGRRMTGFGHVVSNLRRVGGALAATLECG
jgi:hypothetical protein